MKLNVKIRITVFAVAVIAFFALNSTCVGSTIHLTENSPPEPVIIGWVYRTKSATRTSGGSLSQIPCRAGLAWRKHMLIHLIA